MIRKYVNTLIQIIGDTVPDPTFGCEVGVWRGDLSRELLKQFPRLSLYAIDPWDSGGNHNTMPVTSEEQRNAKKRFFQVTEFAANRRCVLPMESVQAIKLMPDGLLDFGFIDACHLYEYVKQDLKLLWPKIKPGGLFSGHDYNTLGDKRGEFGVKRAVDEFAKEKGYEIKVRFYGIWYFQKRLICE